jgi:hypothetical protein
LIDHALRVLPPGLAGNLPVFLMFGMAFYLVSRPNAYESLNAPVTPLRTASGALLFSLGLYVCMAATTSVFLYFNF